MKLAELLKELEGLPKDCEINIIDANPEKDRPYNIERVVWDTVNDVWIEISR